MKAKGFSLVELLLAIMVGTFIMIGVYNSVNLGQVSSVGMERRLIAQQDVRAALDIMAMEIRMASYNSDLLNNDIWVSSSDCVSALSSAEKLRKGIQYPPSPPAPSATERMANSITIQMDINDNNQINNTSANPNEIITYAYDAANMRIVRSTNCAAPQPFIGDTPTSGRPRVVRIVNDLNGNNTFDSGDIPLFRYYDFNNDPIVPTNLPAQIPNIRVVEITIVAETEHIDPATKQRKRLVYSTRVTPRNHGITP